MEGSGFFASHSQDAALSVSWGMGRKRRSGSYEEQGMTLEKLFGLLSFERGTGAEVFTLPVL
jgi:hypothetical protein